MWNNVPSNIDDYIGFCYEITELSSGMKYIGIKKFFKTLKLKPLKGKKRKRKKVVESDWKTYNSSNKELQQKISSDPSNYTKTIIKCCKNVTDMKAYEAYLQLQHYFNGEWDTLYNEMVNLRIRIR